MSCDDKAIFGASWCQVAAAKSPNGRREPLLLFLSKSFFYPVLENFALSSCVKQGGALATLKVLADPKYEHSLPNHPERSVGNVGVVHATDVLPYLPHCAPLDLTFSLCQHFAIIAYTC